MNMANGVTVTVEVPVETAALIEMFAGCRP